jgi:hypothetical protein
MDHEEHKHLWRVYGQRIAVSDPYRLFQKAHPEIPITEAMVDEHFRSHPFEQPGPGNNKINRSQALQEALTTFPKYLFYLFRALYRARSLSQSQIYTIFYLDQSADSPELREQMERELHRLVARNYLYRVWPAQLTEVTYNDPGPFYFIGRQAIPVVEKLEGISPGELPPKHYITNAQNIEPYFLEKDVRFLDVIVALRYWLYRRTFTYSERELVAHVAIEHWYAPSQLTAYIEMNNGRAVHFTPQALVGIRAETRDGSLSTLLPLWIEYDRGLDETHQVVDEILCYGLYYQHEHYQQMFPRLAETQTPGPLLILCETPYRRDEMLQALQAVLPPRPVPIYLVDRTSFCHDPYAEGLLSSPQTELKYSLLERLMYHNQTLIRHRVFSGMDHLSDRSARQVIQDNAKRGSSSPTPSAPTQAPSVEVNFEAWGSGD